MSNKFIWIATARHGRVRLLYLRLFNYTIELVFTSPRKQAESKA